MPTESPGFDSLLKRMYDGWNEYTHKLCSSCAKYGAVCSGQLCGTKSEVKNKFVEKHLKKECFERVATWGKGKNKICL